MKIKAQRKGDLAREVGIRGVRGQEGAIGMMTAFLMAVLVAVISAAAYTAISSAQRGGRTEDTRAQVDAAARAGLDWTRLRALKGLCDASATFSGTSAIPAWPSLTVKTTCAKDGTGNSSYKLTSIACTQATCPGAAPLPSGYAEKRLEARVGLAADQTARHKDAALEWMRSAGPVRLFDFEENSVSSVVHDKRPDGKTVIDLRYDVAEGATAFADSSSTPKTVTSNGALGTDAVFALGGGAVELDGTSASISVAGHSDLYVPPEADFTFETWIYPRTKTGTQGLAYAGSGKFGVRVIGGVVYAGPYGGTAILNSSTLLKASSWNLISVVRQDGHLRIYINGAMATAPVAWSGEVDWTGGVTIGAEPSAYTDGYLDSTSLVVGRATRVDDFALPPSDVASLKRVMRLGCETATGGTSGTGESGYGASFLDHDSSPWRNPVTVVPTAAGDTSTIFPQPVGTYVGYGSRQACIMSSATYGAGYFKVGGTASSKAFGTGDFTVDGNVLHSSSTSSPYFMVGNWGGAGIGGWRVNKYGNFLQVQVIDGTSSTVQTFTGTRTISANTNIHWAVVRKNGRLKTFINGIADLDVALTANILSPMTETWVGVSPQLDSYKLVTVYLDEVGILVGKSVWTKAFAVPEAADRDSYFGDTLKIGFDGSIDDQSNNPRAITNQGVSLGSGSGAAVGTGYGIFGGGRLTVPANKSLEIRRGAFNVSLWVKFAASDMGREVCPIDGGAGGILLCKTANDKWVFGRNGGTMSAEFDGFIKAGVWSQLQVERNNSIVLVYVDGMVLTTASQLGGTNYYYSSTYASIGSRVDGSSALQGAMDEIEITKGRSFRPIAAPYVFPIRGNAFAAERETLLMHFDELATSQTASIVDSSIYARASGSCTSAVCKDEGGEAVFGRSRYSAYNQVGGALPEHMLDKVDFTVDFRTKIGAANQYNALDWGGAVTYAGRLTFNTDGSGLFAGNAASPGTYVSCPAGTFVAGKWMHVAVSVQGNNAYMFKDGKLCGSVSGFTRATYSAGTGITPYVRTPTGSYTYIDEFRILRGRGMWNADFTPPAAPYNGDGTWTASHVLEKIYGDHAAVTGTATPWTDDLGTKGVELPPGAFGRFGPVTSDDLGSAGGTLAVMANPPAASVTGSANTRMLSLSSDRTAASNLLAILRGDAEQTFAGGAGDSTGQWNSVQSGAAAMTRDTWGIFGFSAGSSGTGSLIKDGTTTNTGTVWSPAAVTRTFGTFGADAFGGSGFPATYGVAAVYGKVLAAADWDGIKSGWETGKLPDELKFRSADSTMADKVGNVVAATDVTADANGRSIGPVWVFPGTTGQTVSSTSDKFPAGTGDWEAEALLLPDELPLSKDGAEVLAYGDISVRLLSDGSAAIYSSGTRVSKTGAAVRPGVPVRLHVGRKGGYLQYGIGRVTGASLSDSVNMTGNTLYIGRDLGTTGTKSYKGLARDVRLFVGKHPD
ncbi:LamG-like jellyroll fold domain-containing protein [Dechloromonas sp. ARDL1]|uniref:LamG-like jellyroll fold domain-containing protein n=1 Tax=Dechloromonas sp. ARDL1 TaxID=3322121 RepID=UPI003DA6E363